MSAIAQAAPALSASLPGSVLAENSLHTVGQPTAPDDAVRTWLPSSVRWSGASIGRFLGREQEQQIGDEAGNLGCPNWPPRSEPSACGSIRSMDHGGCPRHVPFKVFLRVAADALAWSGASPVAPLPRDGMQSPGWRPRHPRLRSRLTSRACARAVGGTRAASVPGTGRPRRSGTQLARLNSLMALPAAREHIRVTGTVSALEGVQCPAASWLRLFREPLRQKFRSRCGLSQQGASPIGVPVLAG